MKPPIGMALNKAVDSRFNERGMVLLTGLAFVAILAIMSATAMMIVSTEIKVSGNYRTAKVAFYAAEAGIEEARARLRGSPSEAQYAGDPATSPDPWWSAYILTSDTWQESDDPYYDSSYHNYIPTPDSHTNTTVAANSLQRDISYFVTTRHKREYDAEQTGHTTTSEQYYDGDGNTGSHTAADPGNIIYYGYGNPSSPTTLVQFTTAGYTEHKPVEIITAHGISGKSVRVIEVEIVRSPFPPVVAALYARDDVTAHGTALNVDGSDQCGEAPARPPIYTYAPAATTLTGSPTLLGNPASPQSGTAYDINIVRWVDFLKGTATETITEDQNGTGYGSSSDFEICYSDTLNPLNDHGLRMNNVTGYGILLVEGDLTLAGNFTWEGLVLVTGTLTVSGGGGSKNVLGAILANQTVTINGGIDIRYDSCLIDKAFNATGTRVLTWRQVN